METEDRTDWEMNRISNEKLELIELVKPKSRRDDCGMRTTEKIKGRWADATEGE